MASHLRGQLQATDTLFVHDQNLEAAKNFEEESKSPSNKQGAKVEAVSSPRDAAEQSVSQQPSLYFFRRCI